MPRKPKFGVLAVAEAIGLVVLLATIIWLVVKSVPEVQDRSLRFSPAVHHPEVSGLRVVAREPVEPPASAPDFRLTSHNGSTFSLKNLSGKVVLMTFIYTNCPEACPLITSHYLRLQKEFSSALDSGDLALILITTDPERDTVERLNQFTNSLDGKWSFLTGSLADLKEVWSSYDVYRKVEERNQEVVVYHSYRTYLLDRSNLMAVKYTGVWSSDDVEPDIRKLLPSQQP